jgi:hypothetical protein
MIWNRRFVVFMAVVVVLLVGLFVVHYIQIYTNQQSILHARRQHIYCELLKPGMDKKTVLETLGQFGTYIASSSELPSEERNFRLVGGYSDEQIVGKGYFDLWFKDGKYVEVWIEEGSGYRPICNQ